VFALTMIGGGLGAHLKIIDSIPWLHDKGIIYRLLSEPISTARLFEDVRGQYTLNVLFDTHFLAVWFFALLSILALYRTLKGFSYLRLALTAGAFTLTTLMHLYEGITLTMIALFVCFFCWRKRVTVPTSILTFVVCSLCVAGSLLFLVILYRSSGLSISRWTAPVSFFSTLLLAFPLAWVLIASGIVDYWRKGSLDQCFLLGWMMGCLAL